MLYVASDYLFIYAWCFFDKIFLFWMSCFPCILDVLFWTNSHSFQVSIEAQKPLLWVSCSQTLVYIAIIWRALYIPDIWASLPDFPVWWPGVQTYFTPHFGSMLMSWLWDSYLEKIKCVHWGRIPSVWQSLQLTEAQRQKICEFLNGCFFWTILKRQDCVSLLFGVRFIIFRSITLIGHLSKLTKEMEFKIAIFHYRVFRESCTWQHGKAVEVAPVPEGTSWTQENQMEDVHVLKLLQH